MNNAEAISVLLIDDHSMFCQALTELLTRDGLDVVGSAGTVHGGVEAAERHKPDVILLDYELPDGTGVDATGLLRRAAPDAKIVMLTASVNENVLVAAIEAGCSGYITKNKAVEEVVSAVRSAHEGEALISPSMLARLLPRLRGTKRGIGTDLTPREHEVLSLMAEGLTNSAIAARLVISTHTVRNHVQSVLDKLHAHSKLEAVAIAAREGLVRYG